MTDRYFEEFAIGRTFGSGRLVIDAERIMRFAVEFDPQPFHVDENAGPWEGCGSEVRSFSTAPYFHYVQG